MCVCVCLLVCKGLIFNLLFFYFLNFVVIVFFDVFEKKIYESLVCIYVNVYNEWFKSCMFDVHTS